VLTNGGKAVNISGRLEGEHFRERQLKKVLKKTKKVLDKTARGCYTRQAASAEGQNPMRLNGGKTL